MIPTLLILWPFIGWPVALLIGKAIRIADEAEARRR